MKTYFVRSALAQKVLVVARVEVYENMPDGKKGLWAAYIDAVPGMNHNDEYEAVARCGDKLSKHLAEVIFPQIAEEFIWNT